MGTGGTETGRVPIRTCRGCGERKPRNKLWRFALDSGGKVVKDFEGRLSGRHVYCCQNDRCLNRFMNNQKKVSRAFRAQVVCFDEELMDLFGSGV